MILRAPVGRAFLQHHSHQLFFLAHLAFFYGFRFPNLCGQDTVAQGRKNFPGGGLSLFAIAFYHRQQDAVFVAEYDPSDRTNGLFGILPADLAYRLCWNIDVEFLHCYIEPAFISHIAHESINPDRVELALELKKTDPLICQIGHALKADLEIDGVGSRFYADSMATALAAHLLRHYSTRNHHFQDHEDGLSKVKLKQAIEYINTHLSENLSLMAIAAELDMSQFYFCRLFKHSMGMTPHQYLIQQRIERAKQLLKQPKLTIASIAIKCGFANQSHLAKQFRQHTGLTPKQFRRV